MTKNTMSTSHVSVRLDAETIARVDALAPQFSTHWRPATRSDVLRALILTALDRHEGLVPSRFLERGGGKEEPVDPGGGERPRKSGPEGG
jgi:hypothetical protein